MRFAGAFLCGTVFGFGLFLIAWLPWPLANVFPLIPWMLFATERLIRRPGVLSGDRARRGRRPAVLRRPSRNRASRPCSLSAATSCCGSSRNPAAESQRCRGGPAREVSRLGALFRSPRGPGRSVFVLAIVVGTALAAVAIVPFVELLRNSSDLSSRPRSMVYVQPKFFFASLLPTYFNGVPGSFEIETLSTPALCL